MNDPKTIWQNQGSERAVVPLGLLRNKLRQLHRKIVLQLAFATGVGLIALDLFCPRVVTRLIPDGPDRVVRRHRGNALSVGARS